MDEPPLINVTMPTVAVHARILQGGVGWGVRGPDSQHRGELHLLLQGCDADGLAMFIRHR